jgi:hypothetical protein
MEVPLSLKDQHIDWAKELRKIEREFDGLPPELTPPTTFPAQQVVEVVDEETEEQRSTMIGVVGRVSLVVVLALALPFWPYQTQCGVSLYTYLVGATAVAAGGCWTALWTWRNRMPRFHALSLVLILWGATLAAMQVLPRVGYTVADSSVSWFCP